MAFSYLADLRKLIPNEGYQIMDNLGLKMKNITDKIAKELKEGDFDIENIYKFSYKFKPTKDYKLLLINEGEAEFDEIEKNRRQRQREKYNFDSLWENLEKHKRSIHRIKKKGRQISLEKQAQIEEKKRSFAEKLEELKNSKRSQIEKSKHFLNKFLRP